MDEAAILNHGMARSSILRFRPRVGALIRALRRHYVELGRGRGRCIIIERAKRERGCWGQFDIKKMLDGRGP